jgi:hypothetical protein
LTTVALQYQSSHSITHKLYPFNTPLSVTAFTMSKIPVQTLRQTARASTQHAHGPSYSGARVATQPLSTQSATVDQTRTSQTFSSQGDASTSPGCPVVDAKPTRTEQLVWLAKHSLAASQVRKCGDASAIESERIAMNQEKQGGTHSSGHSYPQAWDGPTVWAHLW